MHSGRAETARASRLRHLRGDQERIRRALAGAVRAGQVSLVVPGDEEYETARRTYNRMHDHHPLALVRTVDAEAIRAVLNLVREVDLPLAVRGGGHHIAGFGSCEAGVVLDFSPFREVKLDTASGIARVAPGARLGDVDAALCPQGYVVPSGTVSDTGMAGLTLGGGIGWLVGIYGLSCDHLVGADVMLPDGRRVRAEDDPELLWGLRGGGGNFGIVTEFRFRARPLPRVIVGSVAVELEQATSTLIQLLRFLASECPRALTVAPVLRHSPSGRGMSVDFCIAGSREETSSASDALYGVLGDRRWSVEHDAKFPTWQRAFDKDFLPPLRGYWKSCYTSALTEDQVGRLVEAVAKQGPIETSRSILIEHLHGAFSDADESTSAFPLRWATFGVLAASRWPNAAEDVSEIEWVRGAHRVADTSGGGVSYSNYTSIEDSDASALYGHALRTRLGALKVRTDPGNLLRRNHNIHLPQLENAQASSEVPETLGLDDVS